MDDGGIGRRLREIRAWRGLSLRATAELAGFSAGYLSLIERGLRPVDKRTTLEALAGALRVAPSELGSAFPPSNRAGDAYTAARLHVPAIEDALADLEIGDRDPGSHAAWSDTQARADALAAARRTGDYARQAELLPSLISDLNAAVGQHGPAALRGLVTAYQRAATTTKTLGVRGVPAFAALRARQAADHLGDPAWQALAAVATISTSSRPRAVLVADRTIDSLSGSLDDQRCREMAGALHLGAALAEAVLGRADRAYERVVAAGGRARRRDGGVPDGEHDHVAGERVAGGLVDGHGFGGMLFGPSNVRMWRMSVAVEAGDGGRVHELGSGWDVRAIPSPRRHADYWTEMARGMATSPTTRDDAVTALLRAEELAPDHVRSHPLLRETVRDLLRRTPSDRAAGREVRGLAFRMGLS